MGIASDDERSELMNLETMESISFPLTPHVISTSVNVNYNDVGGVGASSVDQVYANTSAEETTIEFPYYRVGLANSGGLSVETATAAMEYHRSFVRSLTLPGTRSDGLSKGAPPLCLLTIPGHLTWKCRVRSPRTDTRKGDDGKLLELKMTITFKEEWTEALSSEDILEKGYSRG
ncbi:MAG: hypothetical protein PHX83_06870 [Acidobacteriia bacterium]|nr:hypothetical protein [Terriglobia bacterium]